MSNSQTGVTPPSDTGGTPDPKVAIKRACDAVGGQTEMATALTLTRQTVHMWCKGTRAVPVAHCRSIRRLTLGAVSIEELRPDVCWCTLPGQGIK